MASDDHIDLDSLTLGELEHLAKRGVEEISRKRAAGREWLHQHGARINETNAPRYQNPKNAAQTWSGKGKQPNWVDEALARGSTLESLLSENLLPAAQRSGKGREGGS